MTSYVTHPWDEWVRTRKEAMADAEHKWWLVWAFDPEADVWDLISRHATRDEALDARDVELDKGLKWVVALHRRDGAPNWRPNRLAIQEYLDAKETT